MPRLLLILLIGSLLAACQPKEHASLIITNATIYTVSPDFDTVQAMAIRQNKIIATGTTEEVLANFTADSIIDLNGLPVYPGFHDPHCHFVGYAQTLRQANLMEAESLQEVVGRLQAHHQNYPADWVLGRGWDQNDWPTQQFPTNDALNKAFPNTPVYLTRVDGHAALVNNKALEMAGLTPDTVIAGGQLLQQNGQLTGVLIDNAMTAVRQLIPAPTFDETQQLLTRATNNLHQVGLTSVSDAGLYRHEIEWLDSLLGPQKLPLRVDAWLAHDSATIAHYTQGGVQMSNWLRIGTIKLYADGALGSRGALMLKEYSDDPGNHGLQVTSKAEMQRIAQLAYDNGFQVATHAIGDAANRLVLDVYSNILPKENRRRWRIEHSQVIHPNDFARFGEWQIVPSIQSTHATSDMYWADERLGPERLKGGYAYQDLLQQNGWLPNGSDFPVEYINPLFGFYAAVVRKDQQGWPEQGFQPKNALTRQQALQAMTIWAARASFREHLVGSLEPGKLADFVVLENDILKAPADSLFAIKVAQTWVDGKRVY